MAFAIPLARASSDRVRPCSPRRRRRLAATTGMRSFTMPNERTNESNGNTHRVRDGARVIAPFAVAVARLRGHLRRARPRRGPGRPAGRRLLGHHLRRLGAVRRDLGALGGRDAGGGHRRRRAAQHALHADRALGRAVAARARVAARPARAARRRRVLGGEPPRRRALRPAAAVRRRADALLLVGGRHDARSVAGSLLGDPERSGSTPPSRRSSWRCSPARCAGAPAVVAALGGAAVATALVPFVPPGVPVVAAVGRLPHRAAAPAGARRRRDARLGARSRWWARARSC